MIDETSAPDVAALLRLDPARPDEAAALRIGIAKLAGYRMEGKQVSWKDEKLVTVFPDGWYNWYLFSPDGLTEPYAIAGQSNEDPAKEPNVWKRAFEEKLIPDYPESLDAALTLPLSEGVYIKIETVTGDELPFPVRWHVELWGRGHQEATENSASLAVCYAWLLYRQYIAARAEAGHEGEG